MQRTRMTAAALTAATALLAGCGGTGQDEADAPGAPAQQEQAQHEPAQGHESGQEQTGQHERTEADAEFLQGMIPHHQQAVTMSEMAQGRTDDPQVREMADRILAAQGPEIERMSGWLTEWGAPPSGDGSEHEMSGEHRMHGMLSPDQMGELRQAHGAQFDRLYLSLMIEHHEGAVQMAQQELDGGAFAPAKQLAKHMIDAQRAEIDEMRQLLRP